MLKERCKVTNFLGADLDYLDCPVCGEVCISIPPCREAHTGCQVEVFEDMDYWWCEDRRGVCGCGAKLRVMVDDIVARLIEEE